MTTTETLGRSGVTEVKASYGEALRVIGTQDAEGDHIGIVSVSWVGLRLVGLALRLLGLAAVIAAYVVRQPLSWLPVPAGAPAPLLELRDWELFSFANWAIALFLYLLYFAIAQFKSSVFVGQSGAEIHLARHKKIVDTVRFGEYRVVLDPRVYPLAVVLTKYFLLPASRVDATTKDNITLSHTGAFFLRVKDSFRLLVKGGFPRFLQQLEKLHASTIQEEALGIRATEFNRFLVDPVRIPGGQAGESITVRLRKLEQSDLSVDSLTGMSEIDELDVSGFDLSEPDTPKRHAILPRLQELAGDYGIEIVDYLPMKNTVPNEFLETLAVPLISSLTRLDQATEALKEIIGEEIEEEIAAKVSTKQLALLEIRKIIQEIKAVNDTLANEDNRYAIVHARTAAMRNLAEGLLATVLSRIEALRNWHLWYPFFIPFLVSQRDQVVDTTNAGYTGDFASISLRNQITLRITDSPTFITNTSPATLMKIVNFYASYIVLRMIVSVTDSRVKFMGRDRLDNLVQALNRYLSHPCGVSAVRATMPDAENPILDDLEDVRTGLKSISAMTEKKQVRLEAEVKVVESSIRRERKAARNEALQLQQQRITLETHITEEVNTRRQELLINARQRLEESHSKAQEEVATWKAKVRKAVALRESHESLERDLDLRIARIKRAFMERLIPEHVQVLGVQGIGSGFGLSLGNQLLERMIAAGKKDSGGDGDGDGDR